MEGPRDCSGTPSFNLKKLFEKTAEQRDPEYVQLQLPVANRPRTDLNLESHERFTASSVTEEEQKKSPLALLAATCSSIGKSEPSKETGESTEPDKTSLGRKISDDETRSSFKPYKHTAGEIQKIDDMNTEKAGFRAPSKENNTSVSPITSIKEDRAKNSVMPAYSSNKETHCGSNHSSPQNRVCGMFVDPSQQTFGVHALHKEYGLTGCVHPASLLPFKGTIQPYPVSTGQDPSSPTLKTHALPTSMPLSFPTSFPQCGCGFCSPHPGDTAPVLNNMSTGRHLLHNPVSTPYMDYLQRAAVCRDVNCTNCKPQYSPYAFPNPVSQCGPHCTQCDSVKPDLTPPSPFPCFTYPHNMALYKPGAASAADETSPYVCNWVAGTKHCGKSFATSEDLFQHLRTHTQAGNQASPATYAAQSICNVHGCPCKLRTSPLQSSLHSARYRPYYYKPPGFPAGPTGCYSPYPLHGYDAHRLFK